MDTTHPEIENWQDNFLPEKHWIERIIYFEFAQIHREKLKVTGDQLAFEQNIKRPLTLTECLAFHVTERIHSLENIIISSIKRIDLEYFNSVKDESTIPTDPEQFIVEYDDFQDSIFRILTSDSHPKSMEEAIFEINSLRSMLIWLSKQLDEKKFEGKEVVLWTPIILTENRIAQLLSFCSGWINRLPYELQTPKKSLRAVNKEKSNREQREKTKEAILNLIKSNFHVSEIGESNTISSRNRLIQETLRRCEDVLGYGGGSTIRDIVYGTFPDSSTFFDDLKKILISLSGGQ